VPGVSLGRRLAFAPMSAPLQPGHPSRAAGITLIVATLLSWAAVPLFLRVFREWGLDAFSSNGWRYGVSAAFWLPFLFITWRRGRLPASLLAAAIVPFLFNAVGQTFFAWVFYILDPGFGTFIFRVQIVFVTIGAWLLFPAERGTLRSPRYWIGVAGVVLGSIGLVVFSGQAPRGATAVGIAVALASGALFAGYGLAVRYYVSQYHPVTAFGVICQYTAGGVLAVMFARSQVYFRASALAASHGLGADAPGNAARSVRAARRLCPEPSSDTATMPGLGFLHQSVTLSPRRARWPNRGSTCSRWTRQGHDTRGAEGGG